MTPQQFIAKWGTPDGIPGSAYALNEEQGAQSHFLDLCELLDVPKSGSAAGYLFEEKSTVIGGKTGYADVSMRGVFGWENKAPGKNLDTAKPAWLQMAHQQLDLAVAKAYAWDDYSTAMPDDDILKRLLALNLARSATISSSTQTSKP